MCLISNIEVIRGPSSLLYGNSSGGVININTLSDNSAPYFRTSAIFGAYQYQSLQKTRVFDWNNSSLVVHYDKRRSNGFRDFSDYITPSTAAPSPSAARWTATHGCKAVRMLG